MLDLHELEKKLDEALERETSETLTDWLMTQRLPRVNSVEEENSFVWRNRPSHFSTSKSKAQATGTDNEFDSNNTFATAA